MRLATVTALLIVLSLYLIIAVAGEVYIDDYLEPRSAFTALFLGTVLTGVAGFCVELDVPS